MLYEDLPKLLHGRFEVVVLDASPPEGWEPPNKENDQADPDA